MGRKYLKKDLENKQVNEIIDAKQLLHFEKCRVLKNNYINILFKL